MTRRWRAADCRRLAYHAFDLEDDGVFEPAKLQTAFENAARLCPADLAKERARLHILRRRARPRACRKNAIEKGGKADKALTVLDRARQRDAGQQGTRAGERGCAARPARRSSTSRRARRCRSSRPTLRERWMAIADATTANPQFAPADQLAAQLMKIRAAKAYAADGKVPTDVRSVALHDGRRRCWRSSRNRTCAPAW